MDFRSGARRTAGPLACGGRARDHGATLALVKGRMVTSAPVLLRAGFTDFGEERCYWLPLG